MEVLEHFDPNSKFDAILRSSNKNLHREREEQKSRKKSPKIIQEISSSVIGLPSPLLLSEPPNIS